MSNNPFYNNFTFQFMPPNVPPPPLPPAYYMPPTPPQSDQEFVKFFQTSISIPTEPQNTKPILSITNIKNRLRDLVSTLNQLKNTQNELTEKLSTVTDEEWELNMESVEHNKAQIKSIMSEINDTYLETLRKLLSKRSAKRMRLKRVKMERKKEKGVLMGEKEERSRKIDEHLQKIKDDIAKAKQEEEAKVEADVILKDVRRKKSDARKIISKLDALVKLRRARQNTAKGRGENVSDKDATTFVNNIEKLKSLWLQKLSIYDKEESELRTKLRSSEQVVTKTDEVQNNLQLWREFLFGETGVPQADFNGDIGRFVNARSTWDEYVSSDGSPIPIGWVLPLFQSQ